MTLWTPCSPRGLGASLQWTPGKATVRHKLSLLLPWSQGRMGRYINISVCSHDALHDPQYITRRNDWVQVQLHIMLQLQNLSRSYSSDLLKQRTYTKKQRRKTNAKLCFSWSWGRPLHLKTQWSTFIFHRLDSVETRLNPIHIEIASSNRFKSLLLYHEISVEWPPRPAEVREMANVGKNWIYTFIKRRDELKTRFARRHNHPRTKFKDPKLQREWFERVLITIM